MLPKNEKSYVNSNEFQYFKFEGGEYLWQIKNIKSGWRIIKKQKKKTLTIVYVDGEGNPVRVEVLETKF